jgi:pyridoxal phosphate enzyme (YggS family)
MIKENLEKILSHIPVNVKLIAVSKTKPVQLLQQAYEAGQRDFGENRVNELVDKEAILPKDINWHMIGHLQTKKVKKIAAFVHLIHGVDSFKLLTEINKQAERNERIIDVLLQFHIAQESSKFGFDMKEIQEMVDDQTFFELKNVRIIGVMGMATFTDDEAIIRSEFQSLADYFQDLKNGIFPQADYFKEISMGMSGDYLVAIDEGSTMVRVGSAIFGARN